MTAQVGERLVIESQELTMCTEPLECWFEQLRGQGGARPAFRTRHTALARGYVGRWGFDDVRLHLLGLQGRPGVRAVVSGQLSGQTAGWEEPRPLLLSICFRPNRPGIRWPRNRRRRLSRPVHHEALSAELGGTSPSPADRLGWRDGDYHRGWLAIWRGRRGVH